MSLKGKKALVTGSSRGIGSAIATALAKEGAEVIVHYAGRSDKAEEVAAGIREQGGSCRVVQADLSDPEGAKCLYTQTGDVDILVLNASMQFRRPWQEITREEFYRKRDGAGSSPSAACRRRSPIRRCWCTPPPRRPKP